MRLPPDWVVGREAPLGARHFIRSARGNHMCRPSRPHQDPWFNNIVGVANGIFVMLHDDNRKVTQIAQAFKRGA